MLDQSTTSAGRGSKPSPRPPTTSGVDHSLTNETSVEELDWVDETSTRQVQALRGHVTRELLDDIENLMSSSPDIYVKLDEEY
jgi:hypothetical protein